MKKIALFTVILMVPVFLAARNSPIDKLFKKYNGHEGFTSVLLNQEMFEIFSKMVKSEGEIKGEFGDLPGKIKRVRVLAQEDEGEKTEGVNFMRELEGMNFEEYEELMVVKEADEEVMILAREVDGKLAELLVIVSGDENVLVSIEGRFSMKDLASLSMLEGLEGLGGLDVMGGCGE